MKESRPHKVKRLHPWKVAFEEAIRIQARLRDRVISKNTFSQVRTVGGMDVAYSRKDDLLFGAVVVLSFPEMEALETATACGRATFPYLPGLLSFREAPVLIRAFRALKTVPDVILHDGHGIAHPREFGSASHLGLWLDLPSVGCAKTPLLKGPVLPGPLRGDFKIVRNEGGKEVGAVLRTRENTKPVYVSPGHRVDLMTSVRIVLTACRGYRIPEPLRKAHQAAVLLRRQRELRRSERL